MTPELQGHHHDHEIPPHPKDGTTAAAAYFRSALSDFALFDFIIEIVLRGDYVAFVAKHALDGSDEYKAVGPEQLAKSEPGQLTRSLRERRQVLLEMFLARLVDNFQTYLVDIVRAVLHSRPAMLSTSQQTLSLEEVLKYDRIEDLVHDIIERRVNALSYEGFSELQSWCVERGLRIEVPVAQNPAVIELIATRNVIAHNHSLIDERYLRTVPTPRFTFGEVRRLEVDDLFGALALFHRTVTNTDRLATEKFQLPTGALSPQPKAAPASSPNGGPGDKAVGNAPP